MAGRLRLGAAPSSLSHLIRPRPSSHCHSQFVQPLWRTRHVQLSRISTGGSGGKAGRRHRGSAPSRSLPRRILSLAGRGIVLTFVGYMMTMAAVLPAAQEMVSPPTSEETLRAYTPPDAEAQAVEDHINAHPTVAELRARPELTESRPHLKIPAAYRTRSLTAGTLMGPGRVTVPPLDWTEEGGRSYYQVAHLGADLCGHPGIVHGGYLATMLDEGLARCCMPALPNKIGMTASLSINYRAPTPAGSYVILRCTTTKVEGRKAYVEGRIETLAGPGETPVVLADATALFIEPRQAAAMKAVMPAVAA
ncbi:hypothetical protein RB601_007248 [Gaeumannomyces tritici]